MKKKKSLLLMVIGILLIIVGLCFPNDKDPEKEIKSANKWMFRSLGTMNVTKDEINNYDINQISSLYTTNINKTVGYAKELNANYIEIAIELGQKSTLEDLYKYYEVLPTIARKNNLKVYFRGTPSESEKSKILTNVTSAEEFSKNCWDYFYNLEKLWFQTGKVLVENNDIISTWAEGDSYFTNALEWEMGTIRYKEYIKVASKFVKYLENKYNLNLYYTESLSGGDARLRDELDKSTSKYVDFILWDHYAGMMIDSESEENMKIEAKKAVEAIKKYSETYNIKIGLGEWSTHWYTPKAKEDQYKYIKIMTDELDNLSSKNFVGMEYFHFALVSTKIDYNKASTYYASQIVDKGGKYPSFNLLKEVYKYHAE